MKRLAAAAVLLLAALIAGGAVVLDRLYPPATARFDERSTAVTARDGSILRVFTTHDGLWRLPVKPEAVAQGYFGLLVAVEDKRFFGHFGFDPMALARAAWQAATRGRVVSGGSTLTMQVVRLLEPRPRTLRSKLIEIARAVQLEAHWSKRQILSAYITLAPMGRNIEGVRAGSLAWFGKEPRELSDAEIALLVALPRDPNHLRPDRPGGAAAFARARVLRRGVAAGVLDPGTLASALAAPFPEHRHPMPALAPHLAEHLAAEQPGQLIATTLDASLQSGVERLLSAMLRDLPRPVTLAAMVADWHSGAVLARVGSADYFDKRRLSAVDMTRALRSPGSTLKPFIYGMAFDGLRAHPGSLIRDAATRFDDYAPHNFDGGFNGDVTVRQALQGSLNLPAVVTLQRLGPVVLTERFKAAGLPLDLGSADAAPALPIALGGVGTTLERLVTAYAALADGGSVKPLRERDGRVGDEGGAARLLEPGAADAVVDILADMPAPRGVQSRAGRLAYKTGTSYRFRDGWALGFDADRVIGVWMGRADGGSCPCVGASAAAVLFRLFDLLPPAPLPPRVLTPAFAGPPPPALLRLDDLSVAAGGDRPHITFPISDSRLLVDPAAPEPVKLAATGGRRPYRWLVDGHPVESRAFARETLWRPGGVGFSTVSVVDADGLSDQAAIRVLPRGEP